jgi:hypothetical protein
MSTPFDIFQLDRAGVRWLESADTLDRAKTRIHELAEVSPGEYLLLDHNTGNKVVIKPLRVDEG